ncbi:FGGY-family carbohydrate kinase [Leadbettera azotonutricia]|uniref:FGGY domain protein n=1 Tax=Leadbettera azotonutricia (strain ATCC BAA-888 / DSM 13862 / ZAS-9) TaxID=545695 RepID=F5YEA5_LEAAZ|nr:FGGY-family carbohydrate kinase [Leadbettera azotonutricia]AEF82040.1 FGGY domain protein [Leadbettera azotonutricia ZAS-9]
MYFCGLDVGTTGVKAIVFDEKGNQISGAYRNYAIKVSPDGTRLLTAGELWGKTKEVFAETAAAFGREIKALCISTFGEAFVAVDKSGKPIFDPMLFTDRWGEKEYFEAEKKTSPEEIARICGLPLSPSYSLSKVLYLKFERPDIYEKIDRILFIEEFIALQFCENSAVDYSAACRTMFFDVRTCAWSDELISRFGLERSHFGDTKPMGTILGTLRQSLCREWNIPENVHVIIGGHDQPVNAIGSGLRDGYAVCSMGTAECITPIIGAMLPEAFTANKGIPSEPLWEKGKFCALAYNQTSGLLVQWFVDNFASNGETPAAFDGKVQPKPSKIMVQPYLMGSGTPYMDSAARLAFIGMDYGTSKYDMYQAILEGLVLDQALNIAVLGEEKIFIKHLIAVGGGSKSRPWLRIKADLLGIPVSVLKVKEAGALGGAILCAAAEGVYGGIEEAACSMSQIKETIEPDWTYQGIYKEKFEAYRALHGHIKSECEFAVKA